MSMSRERDRTALRAFYKSSDSYHKGLQERATDAYCAEYLRMVKKYVPRPARLLDLGCGSGYAAYRFSQFGYNAVGMDISEKFLGDAATRITDNLHYTVGDALELPFDDGVFDAVASFDVIEHVADAEQTLHEMARILLPGGRMVIICPNYWSPVIPLKALINLMRGGPGYLSFYETISAALAGLATTSAATMRKLASSKARFEYRTPRLDGVTDADCDCIYLPSPIDFRRYFDQNGFRVIRYRGEGSSPFRRWSAAILPSFVPTVYVVAEKPPSDGLS